MEMSGKDSDTINDNVIIVGLSDTTEKKLKNLVNENYRLKQNFSALTFDYAGANEKIKSLTKENDCLRKLITNYECSFKSWKKVNEELKSLKAELTRKEKYYEERIDSLQKKLTQEKEMAESENAQWLADVRAELSKANLENRRANTAVEELRQQHSANIAEMKLNFEKQVAQLESEYTSGSKRRSAGFNLSAAGGDDSSRLYFTFQKKLENQKQEYERKITDLQTEIEALKQPAATCNESSREETHVLKLSDRKDVISRVTNVLIADKAVNRNCPSSPLPDVTPPPTVVRAFGQHLHSGPSAKKSCLATPKNKQQNDESSLRGKKPSTPKAKNTQSPRRVSFANGNDCVDVFEFTG